MIKGTELRIGNYIYGVSDRIEKIISLGVNFCTVGKASINIQETESYDDIKPISLTHDILEQAGFFNNSYAHFSLKIAEYAYLSIQFKDYACSEIRENPSVADHDLSSPCKYLHQLQNLYFALTGEELQINL